MDINSLTEQELRDLANRLSEVGSSVQSSGQAYSGALSDLASAEQKTEQKLYKVNQGLTGFGHGTIQFTKALVDGKSGMAKYGAGVESVADGIGSMIGAIGPIGMLIGSLIKIVGKVTNSVLAQNQAYLNAYDALAEFGGVTGLTADELKAQVLSLDYNEKTLAGLIKPITNLGSDIMFMGKTAGEAQQQFMKLSAVGRETIGEFSRLGISQENLTELQAEYIRQQSKIGLVQTKDIGNLKDISIKYATNLVKLSALTGQSIDQVKEGQARDLADYKFAATLREEEEKGNDKVVNTMKDVTRKFASLFGENLTSGVREILSTGLAQSTEGARQLYLATGGAIIGWSNSVKEGTMTQEEFLQKTQKAYKDSLVNLGFAAKASVALQNAYGLSPEQMAGNAKIIADAVGETVDSEIENRKKTGDKLLDARIASNDASNATQKAFEAFIQLIAGPVNTAFTMLMHGLKALAQGFIKQLSRLGFAPKEFEFMFMSHNELSEKQTEFAQKISEMTEHLASSAPYLDQVVSEATSPDFGRSHREIQSTELAELKARLKMVETAKEAATPTAPAPATTPAPSNATRPRPSASVNAPPASATPARQPENIRIGEFAKGGITSGPMTGHLGMMHDLEALVPLPDGKTIPVNLNIPQLTEKQQNPLLDTGNLATIIESYTKALTKSSGSSMQTNVLQEAAADYSFIEIITDRMETLLASMRTNTSLQSELLYYVKR